MQLCYILLILLGIAIKSQAADTIKCGTNEILDPTCGSCDKAICLKGSIKPIACKPCGPGCRCAPGFYRDTSGKCISGEKCCTMSPSHVYIKNNFPCPKICNRNGKVVEIGCDSSNFKPGCYCKKGFYYSKKQCLNVNTCVPH